MIRAFLAVEPPMDLPRWDPFRVILALSNERRRRATDRPDQGGEAAPLPDDAPPEVGVRESADEVVITVGLPPVRESDVRVAIIDGELQVHLRKPCRSGEPLATRQAPSHRMHT